VDSSAHVIMGASVRIRALWRCRKGKPAARWGAKPIGL
jgi:hypothetical protein